MVNVGKESYLAVEKRTQDDYAALIPVLDRYGVKIGVQNHCGRMVCNAMGLRHLVEPFDPKHVAIVWDAAHNALSGEEPEIAIEIVWSRLCMVNLKNAIYRRVNEPDAEVAQWQHYWTSGREGLASWPRVAVELKKRDYGGVICLTAEYTDQTSVDRLIAADLALARSLFA
jgi:sugar phosphate isomerase/epimerase